MFGRKNNTPPRTHDPRVAPRAGHKEEGPENDYYANQGYKIIQQDIEDSEVMKEPRVKYTRPRRRQWMRE